MKKLVIVLAVIILVLLGVFFFYDPAQAPAPLQTQTSTTTTQPLTSTDGHLQITSLQNNSVISSPLTITGTVTGGGWFFEATFPVKVAGSDGRIIGTGVAQAQADWMSTSSVPFTAIINFDAATYATGTVLLQKDNPSGAPANDATLSIPVRFK